MISQKNQVSHMNEETVLKLLKQHKNELLPTSRQIYTSAVDKELKGRLDNLDWIKKHFSEIVESTQITAYEIYKTAERLAVSHALKNTLSELLSPKATKKDFFDLLDNNFWALDRFFLSLSQSRRARAGKAFEHIIKTLFDTLGYPYTPQPIINGQPDFLLPSENHFKTNAMDCIIFTVKRTLRERWRQIVTEGTRGYLFFLATIDENISTAQLDEIRNHRIFLVVPERIRSIIYSRQANVISFETFFGQYLDPAMIRWRQNKAIK